MGSLGRFTRSIGSYAKVGSGKVTTNQLIHQLRGMSQQYSGKANMNTFPRDILIGLLLLPSTPKLFVLPGFMSISPIECDSIASSMHSALSIVLILSSAQGTGKDFGKGPTKSCNGEGSPCSRAS